MNAFLLTNGYDEVFAEEQYPAEERVNSFGVPDKFLFDYALNAIRQRANAPKNVIASGFESPQTDDIPKKNKAFSQEDVEYQWMSMCNRMPQNLSGIATRMKNMNPRITEFPNVEVLVENKIFLEEMEKIRGSICNTLRKYLENQDIELTLRLAEHNEQVKILTRREQYEEMEKSNPAIAKLREMLDLELA
jgi:DNA polymerase-3 subunit gamma/tau